MFNKGLKDEINSLKHQLQQCEELCKEYKDFYEGVMALSEGYTIHTMQDIPMDARDTLTEILKHIKLQKSIECNKTISSKNTDMIVFRNGLIGGLELIIQLLSTQPPSSGVSILDRQKRAGQTNTK